ncbi:MAG: helix-turn-helix transcriptional regulator [Moorea sp. SIO4G2]|uniref:helix-turn-helix domain-containing protein n=1 Tax=unclassified Moorena TaxID=2683338 RepID=UPI0013BD71F1|nr:MULTISPECIES: helix-turn-helix transcriptional regulator [unclassified Moorena]NEO63222.1 helix-turn-helix transcriptional regulator [Moorena sp. SIO4G2]NEO89562.1 helix-turn-helix transcriptional regulator [Moorena sp. SIO3G5]NEO17450.1 helix-turn-helix transcriptional regulator [Moorena sp. SIO3E8]NEO41245.1 helix-turn-helix transcriptional regulator [Moorena sp. SIOASIH]NEQ04112.1 helix-turn-helix transcriptional regulator [Moorena sp. SIO3F7]
MGKVGKALKQTLATHGISQNKLAVTLGVRPSVVFRWFHEQTDPSGETIADIAKALQSINPSAAAEFVKLYLGEFIEDQIENQDEDES